MKQLNYFNNSEIDTHKWDDCINHSVNRKVYAFAWYLDIVSNKWGALIYGDYELVFPIIFKKLFFFNKIYHPFFCQQLGPFSIDKNLLYDESVSYELLKFLDKQYKKFDFSINYNCAEVFKQNIIKNKFSINCLNRVNLELDLKVKYDILFSGYDNNTKRNLRMSENYKFYIGPLEDIDVFVSLYKQHVGYKANLKSSDFVAIKSIIKTAFLKKIGSLLALYDTSHNILASAFFILDLNRDILLFNFSNRMLKINTMTILIDEYIRLNASQNKLLDFEGSSIASIKRFYKGFGAIEKNYIHIAK